MNLARTELGTPPATASFPAIGTQATVCTLDAAAIDLAAALLRSELDRLDAACSRFHDSELTRVHARAGSWTAISPLLSDVVQAALDVAQATGGAVDPTVGAAVLALGYDDDFDAIRRDDPRPRTAGPLPAPGWRHVELDVDGGRLRIPPGALLDLGSTAKAWMADSAAALIAEATGGSALVNLGGDIGTCGDAPPEGWQVGIDGDARCDVDDVGLVVALHAGGLASSGTAVRTWRRGGEQLHHIIDPTTGDAADAVWSLATVAAESCLEANASSTAAIVLGARAIPWLEEQALPCRLVGADGSVHRLGGWPEDPLAG